MRFFTFIMRLLPLSVLLLCACAIDNRNHADYVSRPAQDIKQVPAWSEVEGAGQVSALNKLIRSDQLDKLV